MAAHTDLSIAKKNLQQNLGDDMKMYLQNLRSWFKQKITKEEFDAEARSILSEDSVHLHNEFLLAIICRCQSLSSSIVPKDSVSSNKSLDIKHKARLNRLKRKPLSARAVSQKFVPAQFQSYVPVASYKGENQQQHVFASREHCLPDISMLHGRMLVCAWESGLEEVSDPAVKLIMKSVENQLKNILSLVISSRKGYKLRDGKLKYAMGSKRPNPYLRQSQMVSNESTESDLTWVMEGGQHVPSFKPHTELAESMAAREMSLSSHREASLASHPGSSAPISLFDLLYSMQLYRSSISSHSVYAPAVERVIHKLCHPGHEEINQDVIHQQEISIKQTLSNSNSGR